MNYSLDAGAWNSVFAVPSSVVDKYIKLADGASLKLLLYLLRHGGEQFTESSVGVSSPSSMRIMPRWNQNIAASSSSPPRFILSASRSSSRRNSSGTRSI